MEEDLNKKLCEALEDMRKEELPNVCEEIRKILCDFISKYKKENHSNLVFNEPSYRIKDVDSFSEKIPRKNYIKVWGIEEETSSDECKQKIREKLDDLIGFRINCYFFKDEKTIYKSILSGLEGFNIIIKDGKSGPDKQKNGLDIYKLKCEYTSSTLSKRYLFELQIKCLIDNLWGEVDHEIAYKSKQYDYQLDSKANLLKQVYTSLEASDAQLFEFYNSSYTEEDLINSLFFLYTHDEVNEKMEGKNCTIFYNKFFSIFGKKQDAVKDYVAKRLGGDSSYKKKKQENNSDANINYFKYIIEDKIVKDDIQIMVKEIQTIYGILFEFEESDFLNIMISAILQDARKYFPKEASVDTEETDSEEPDLITEQSAVEKEEEENVYEVNNEKMKKLKKNCEFFDSALQLIKESKKISSTYDKSIMLKGLESFCETFYL